MLPLTIMTGAALPIAAQMFTRRLDAVGGSVGALFSANTLGNVIGPLTATFVLMPLLGLRHTVTAGILGLSVAAILAGASDRDSGSRRARMRGAAWIASAVALFALLAPAWNGGLMHSGGFRRWTLEANATFEEFVESRARSTELWSSDGATDSSSCSRTARGCGS